MEKMGGGEGGGDATMSLLDTLPEEGVGASGERYLKGRKEKKKGQHARL